MFDFSLQVLKGDTCHSHSSTSYDNQDSKLSLYSLIEKVPNLHCCTLSFDFSSQQRQRF